MPDKSETTGEPWAKPRPTINWRPVTASVSTAMPELPDIVVYLEALEPRVVGQVLGRLRVKAPQLLRTYDPPISAVEGQVVRGFAIERGPMLIRRFDGLDRLEAYSIDGRLLDTVRETLLAGENPEKRKIILFREDKMRGFFL